MTAERIHNLIRTIRRAAAPAGESSVPDAQLLERYAAARDESAFELLAWRHGGMVLGVCRRVLGDAHEAEDAFQATFLLLARKAAVVARFRTVGGWLHTVAYRVALRARTRRSGRVNRESPLDDPVSAALDPATEASQREVREAIDAEVNRLPEKYRVPFVLYHLEGRSCAEVARELDCPVGTVESWLARARARMRSGLTRRGVAPTPGLLAVLAPQMEWLPRSAAAIRAAMGAATGTPDAVSAEAAVLADEVLKSFALAKVKMIAGVVLLVVAAAGTAGVAAAMLPRAQAPVPTAPAVAAVTPDELRPVVRTTFRANGNSVRAVALTGDGRTLASAGGDARVKLWDVASGQEGPPLRRALHNGVVVDAQHDSPVLCLAFSPDGQTLASAGTDMTVRLWDVATGAQKAALNGHTLYVLAVAFSPDGKTLATAAGSHDERAGADLGELKLWDVGTGQEYPPLLRNHPGSVTSVAFSPDGKTLVSAGQDGWVRLWDLGTGKQRASLRTDDSKVVAVAFSGDGKTFASAGPLGAVKLWDLATQRVRLPLDGHNNSIIAMTFTPDGKTLVTAGPVLVQGKVGTGEVRLWDTTTGLLRVAPLGVAYSPWTVAFSPRGGVLAAGGDSPRQGGELTLWDTIPQHGQVP